MSRLKYFSLIELGSSDLALKHGVNNTPPESIHPAIDVTLAGLERVRAYLGHPMSISSGYRCAELNKLVGGSTNSQHMKGEAVDFTCPAFGTPREVATSLHKARFILGIDQLILENGWVHVSFTLDPRAETLTLVSPGKYQSGLVDQISKKS